MSALEFGALQLTDPSEPLSDRQWLCSLSGDVLHHVFIALSPQILAMASMSSQALHSAAEAAVEHQARRRGTTPRHGEKLAELLRFMSSGPVSRIDAGDDHTIGVNSNGELFAWGDNTDGQLGHQGSNSFVPVPVQILARVAQVSAGFTHTVVATSDGRVFTFGRGLQGQLGHGGEDNELRPRMVEALQDVRIVQVAAGARHTAVASSEGEVYTFGCGGYGRLGHGSVNTELYPRKVEELIGRFVTQVVCGLDFTLVVSSFGRSPRSRPTARCWGATCSVFTFGLGLLGRLGHGTELNELRPRLLEGLVGRLVTHVAAGYNHSVVATSDGRVFTFGRGLQGQLGHGGEDNELRPRMVEALQDVRIVQVAAGARHTAVASSEGEVYSFGYGSYGRLGHGGVERELYPRKVKSGLTGRRVAQITAGGSHTCCVTETGEIFTCGNGGHGRLGHNCETHELEPKMLHGLTAWVSWGAASSLSPQISPVATPSVSRHASEEEEFKLE